MMRILLADDQVLLKDALTQLLLIQPTVKEVVSVSNGKEAIEALQKGAFDLVILDIEMPYKSGLDVLEWIRQNQLSVKVIIVTTFNRPGYFQRGLGLDVDAFVLKDRSITELMHTIDTVMSGKKEYSPELMAFTVNSKVVLTPQEKRILLEMANGLSNQEIADNLFLSNGTVRNYVSSILLKLDAENRTDAVRIAKELGYI